MMRNLDVAQCFLVVAAPVAVLLVFLLPPFQAPDEIAHYYRAYQVAEGGWFPHELGGALPRSLRVIADEQVLVHELRFHPERRASLERVMGGFKRQFEDDEPREKLGFNSALYSPVVYFPQALGNSIGRVIGAGPLALLYWQRLFNAAVSLALVFFALRLATKQSLALLAIALSPMVLFLRSSASADPMTFGVVLLFIAALSRELQETGLISIRRLGAFAILIAILGLCKNIYFPLAGALFCLPASRFGGAARKKFMILVGLCLVTLLPSVLWSASVAHLVAPASGGADTQLQLAHLKAHPLTGIRTLFGAWWENSYFYSRTMMGVLGWLDTPIPDWVNGMLWLLLVQLVLTDNSMLSKSGRVWLGSLVALTAMAVVAAMYVTWTPVAAGNVEGVQGRYFLPLAPAILMVFGVRLFEERRFASISVIAFALLSTSSTIYALLTRYWLDA